MINNDPPLRLLAAFQQAYPHLSPDYLIQAPGREMWVAAAPGSDSTFNIHAPDMDGRTAFSWRTAKFKRTTLNRPLPHWARYPAGVIVMLCAGELDTDGINAVIIGEEPSGPRYEFGMGMAFAALLHEIHQHAYDPALILEIVEQVRRDYIT